MVYIGPKAAPSAFGSPEVLANQVLIFRNFGERPRRSWCAPFSPQWHVWRR